MSGIALDDATTALLAEAGEWRLIGLLLEYPRDGWHDEVQAVVRQVGDPDLRGAAAMALEAASEGAYLAALGPGGAVSPREVAYCGWQEPGKLLADLAAFYAAFAYRPHLDEPPDHVAVEAGFVAYLRMKEAYGRSRGALRDADVAAEAARAFIADHLAVMTGPLADRLAAAGFAGLALAARALLRRVGSPPRTQAAGPCAADADCPGACGSGPDDEIA
jgi:nitrate reductase assembly molybdenum cofactor insertion protein NarJ